jgi:chemotaxis protein MotA
VGSANLLYLPMAGKMKLRMRDRQIMREMTLEGVVSILEGMNPHMLETKLFGFLTEANQNSSGDQKEDQSADQKADRKEEEVR